MALSLYMKKRNTVAELLFDSVLHIYFVYVACICLFVCWTYSFCLGKSLKSCLQELKTEENTEKAF